MIACTRLRSRTANSARGAAGFAAEAIAAAQEAGYSGLIVVRADSAYYCGAVRRAGARFSVTVNIDFTVTCAAIAHNLLRAAGSLAGLAYGKARGATIRRDLIDVAARTARRGHITLHLPEAWHREHEWMTVFTAACGPPPAAA